MEILKKNSDIENESSSLKNPTINKNRFILNFKPDKRKIYIFLGIFILATALALKHTPYFNKVHTPQEVETEEVQKYVMDPNLDGFAMPYETPYSYEWDRGFNFTNNGINSYAQIGYLNIRYSGDYQIFNLREKDGDYYLVSSDYDSKTKQIYKLNNENFASLVQFIAKESNRDHADGVYDVYLTEYIEDGIKKVSIASVEGNDQNAKGSIQIYTANSDNPQQVATHTGLVEPYKGEFTLISSSTDTKTNKFCDEYRRVSYKGEEKNKSNICYFSTFKYGLDLYYIDNPSSVLSLIKFNPRDFSKQTAQMPAELKGKKVFINNSYRQPKAEIPIVAYTISVLEKDLSISKVELDSSAFRLSVKPLTIDEMKVENRNSPDMRPGSLFTNDTDSKNFTSETTKDRWVIKNYDSESGSTNQTIFDFPLSAYQRVFEEYNKLAFVSPMNGPFESIDVPSGVGGGGGADLNPWITLKYDKSQNLLKIYLFGYIEYSEKGNYKSKTLVREFDYNTSNNTLIKDYGYKYFNTVQTSAYSTNSIRMFRGDNKLVFTSGGGDGCGGGSSVSFVDLNTDKVEVDLDLKLLLTFGCEEVAHYQEYYKDLGPESVGEYIDQEDNLIYYSTKEREVPTNDSSQGLDNVTVFDMNTGESRKIKQFPETPAVVIDVTRAYLNKINSPNLENPDLNEVYLANFSGEYTKDENYNDVLKADIYKLDKVKATVDLIEKDFILPVGY